MSKPDKIAEPSMDEILASIRKIIAEEPGPAKPAEPTEARRQPVAAVTIPAPVATGPTLRAPQPAPRAQTPTPTPTPAPTPTARLAAPASALISAPVTSVPAAVSTPPAPAPTPAVALRPAPMAPPVDPSVPPAAKEADGGLSHLLLEEDLADLVDAPDAPGKAAPAASAPPVVTPAAAPARSGGLLNRPRFVGQSQPQAEKPSWPFQRVEPAPAAVALPASPMPAAVPAPAATTAETPVPPVTARTMPEAPGLLAGASQVAAPAPDAAPTSAPVAAVPVASAPSPLEALAAGLAGATVTPPKPVEQVETKAAITAPGVVGNIVTDTPAAAGSADAVPPPAKPAPVPPAPVSAPVVAETTIEAAAPPAPVEVSAAREPAKPTPEVVPEKPAQAPPIVPAAPPVSAAISAPLASEATPTRSLEDTVSELLRPMLRQWLDNNMPRIVEAALRVEMATVQKPVEKKPTTV